MARKRSQQNKAQMRLSFGVEHDRPRRHYFDFHAEVRQAVESYSAKALEGVDPRAFRQESDYVAALAGRLVGSPYDGPLGHVSFSSTIVASRGAKSAESLSGVDWVITATITDGTLQIKKSILIQAKLGTIAGLTSKQRQELNRQIAKMRRLTTSPKVLEIPTVGGQRDPKVISGVGLLQDRKILAVPLGRYLSSRVLTTLDGDTRPAFVHAVQDSRFTRLHIRARLQR